MGSPGQLLAPGGWSEQLQPGIVLAGLFHSQALFLPALSPAARAWDPLKDPPPLAPSCSALSPRLPKSWGVNTV